MCKNGLREGVRGRMRETSEIPCKINATGEILCIFSNSLGACAVVENVKIFASRASRAEFDFLYCCPPPPRARPRAVRSRRFFPKILCVLLWAVSVSAYSSERSRRFLNSFLGKSVCAITPRACASQARVMTEGGLVAVPLALPIFG